MCGHGCHPETCAAYLFCSLIFNVIAVLFSFHNFHITDPHIYTPSAVSCAERNNFPFSFFLINNLLIGLLVCTPTPFFICHDSAFWLVTAQTHQEGGHRNVPTGNYYNIFQGNSLAGSTIFFFICFSTLVILQDWQ